jgi:hypothetical protein
MGFEYAGNLAGSGAPVVRHLQIGETCYTGQLLMGGIVGAAGGAVQIADPADSTDETSYPIMGICTGVQVIDDAGWNATNRGDTATYDTTAAAQLANDPIGACHIEMTNIQPDLTLVRAPIYNGAYGTALTECTITTTNAAGTTLTHVGYAVTDMTDNLCTAYCRSGASRGHYRVITTTTSTTVQTLTIAMPYGSTAGDVFVFASCVFGQGEMNFPATANCIDGNIALTNGYSVDYHNLNLEESGREFAVLAFKYNGCGPVV